MIQTTEVWTVTCDTCHQPYGKTFQSQYYMIQEVTRLGKWVINFPSAICNNCLITESNHE